MQQGEFTVAAAAVGTLTFSPQRPLSSYPAIRGWMRELYQNEAFSSTTSMEHIKNHYFTSHAALNQYAVVPHGPGVLADLALPHGRDNVE